jgi:hypothetical protein
MNSYYLCFCLNSDNEREKREYFDLDYRSVMLEISADEAIVDVLELHKIY